MKEISARLVLPQDAQLQIIQPTFPPDTPLLAKTPKAAKIFDISPRKLYDLRIAHKELRELTVKIGHDVYYDVPKCYAWFGEHMGANIEVQE